jgi:hypothetical protein
MAKYLKKQRDDTYANAVRKADGVIIVLLRYIRRSVVPFLLPEPFPP